MSSYWLYGWSTLVTCIHTSLDDVHRWRVCFWVSVIPAALLAVLMEFCAESPHWLFKVCFFHLKQVRA